MAETRRRNVGKENDLCVTSNSETHIGSNGITADSYASVENEGVLNTLTFWVVLFFVVLSTFLVVGSFTETCWSCNGNNCNNSFDTSLARSHLRRITALGPRTVGSIANEIAAPNYLRNELMSVAAEGNNSGLNVFFDEQVSTFSSFRTHFYVSTYNNVRNFILRFHDPRAHHGDQKKRAFLVNCHYDTAPNSPGASDAFVNCAIMLEASRVIAKGSTYLYNDIIFLFNGAEETILLAAHAFVTQHPWAKDVAAFLNLEGAGAGNRLMVFQAGPGPSSDILMHTYSKAFRQPFASVFAEDLFQSGILPSDTDFRIFRDYGLVPGLDLSYVKEAYAYHTPFDTESRISPECLSQCGNNVLKFVELIAQDERIQNIPQHIPDASLVNNDHLEEAFTLKGMPALIQLSSIGRFVYFDLVGFVLVLVPWSFWKIVNYVLLSYFIFSMCSSRRLQFHRWCGLAMAFMLQLFTQIFGFCFAVVLGLITHQYGCRMTWYSAQYNIVGAFISPFIWWFVWVHTYACKVPGGCLWRLLRISNLVDKKLWRRGTVSAKYLDTDLFDAALLFLCVQLLFLTYMGTLACFSYTIWIGSALLVRRLSQWFSSKNMSSFHRLLSFTWIIPPLFFHAYFCRTLLIFLIPTMGRVGHTLKPDVVIAGVVFFLMMPLGVFSVSWLQHTTNSASKTLRILLLNACLSYAILIHASPYGFPYSVHSKANLSDPLVSPRFQRIALVHTSRFLRSIPDSDHITSTDHHFLLVSLDTNNLRYLSPDSYPSSAPPSFMPLDRPSIEDKKIDLSTVTSMHCNTSLPYCGVAAIYPFIHLFEEFHFIPAPTYSTSSTVGFKLISRQNLDPPTPSDQLFKWNFTFSIDSGPPYTHVLIRTPSEDIQIINWSFASTASQPFPVPLPSKSSETEAPGLHYFIYHINAQAQTSNLTLESTDPWLFWIVIESPTKPSYFDLAVVGLSMDSNHPLGSSSAMDEFISLLPPWIVSMTACAVYDQRRYGLN